MTVGEEIRRAFDRMGYRELGAGVWCKPVGLHLFVFTETDGMWTNKFVRSDNGQVDTYEQKNLKERLEQDPNLDLIRWIERTEAYTEIRFPERPAGGLHRTWL